MNTFSRRSFLKSSLLATASAAVWPGLLRGGLPGANSEIRYAVVGFNGRGKDHLKEMREVPGTRLVALCDADRNVLNRELKQCENRGDKVEGYTDVRRLLDNKDVDVVTFATPNHWHSLGSIWALQAGKDVYVEKPVSHNVWEGRQLVKAARRHQRIVQTGTQCRSNPGVEQAMQWLREGHLGKILCARGLCYKPRPSIGK